MRKSYRSSAFQVALLAGLLLLPCVLKAQTTPIWWMKTDKGQYIEMSRVKQLIEVDGNNNFQVVVNAGEGATGVEYVTFEKSTRDVVKGDANGNGIVEVNDVLEIANYILGKPSDKFVFDRANVNGDKKVDATDLVAVVNIVKTAKNNTRGMFKPAGMLKSTSNDEPGTISSQEGTTGWDESRQTYWEGQIATLEPLPGTITPLYNNVNLEDLPKPVVRPEPRTIVPEPEEIIPQEEPTVDPDPQDPVDPDPQDPVDPDPGNVPVDDPDLGSVPYFRVQFTENLLEVKKYAADDGYTFFNPARDYLDFKYYLPFTHANNSGVADDNSYYYIGTGPDAKVRTRFTLAKTLGDMAIKQVTAYNQPIKTIRVSSTRMSSEVDGMKKITYTFNALPRNIEELKTLEVNDREYFNSPHFVTALFICCLNRLPDNSSDAWNMINYLRTHTATVGENNIMKMYKGDMQNIVQFLLGPDDNGFPSSNGLRSYFAGSSPDNQYTPTTPYRVTIVEKSDVYTTEDGILCAKLYVESSGADDLMGALKLRKIDGHGWLVYSGESVFTKKMKPQSK